MHKNKGQSLRLSLTCFCESLFLPALAQILPTLTVSGILLQLGGSELYGAVVAAAGGKEGSKAFEGDIQIHTYAFVDGKGADAANSVAD